MKQDEEVQPQVIDFRLKDSQSDLVNLTGIAAMPRRTVSGRIRVPADTEESTGGRFNPKRDVLATLRRIEKGVELPARRRRKHASVCKALRGHALVVKDQRLTIKVELSHHLATCPRLGDRPLQGEPGAFPGVTPLLAFFDRFVLKTQTIRKVHGLYGVSIGRIKWRAVTQYHIAQPHHELLYTGQV